ncbi:hypothetical protein [Ferruginibacter sp.]
MDQNTKISSRKKFLLWGATLLSAVTVFKFIPEKKKEKNPTVKMLGQDGKLVEVDIEKLIHGRVNKINDEQLKNWVTKK